MIGFLLWYSCAQIERYCLSEEYGTTDHKMRLNLRAGGFEAGSSMKAGAGGGGMSVLSLYIYFNPGIRV